MSRPPHFTVCTPLHGASSSFSVFAFATFRCSDGTAAERAAAQLNYMVESRLAHGYSMVLHVDCAVIALHTRVEHSAFRLRVCFRNLDRHAAAVQAESQRQFEQTRGAVLPRSVADRHGL